jgi:nitroreductase
MEFFDVVQTRRSVRSFKDEPVPDEVLSKVLETVRIAPSGSNRQPWRFIIVKDETVKKRLIPACGDQKWLVEAPVIVVACG